MTSVRPATPHDANALVDLAESVGREEGRWILGTGPWRSASDERRYLRSIQRYPDAAVFVAEDGERLVGRLSLSRDPHPADAVLTGTPSDLLLTLWRRANATTLTGDPAALTSWQQAIDG